MLRSAFVTLLLVAAMTFMTRHASSEKAPELAATPPMGWNSWDAYAETVSESDIRANAKWMAEHLKEFGWQYIVVDSGWYVTNHSVGTNAETAEFSLDDFGLYAPAVNTFPSAAQDAGFKPLDVWDLWHSDTEFPSGILNQFARAAKWAPFSSLGHWPDADMLPIGCLEPARHARDPR